MPEMIYNWKREREIKTADGVVLVEELVVVEDGKKTEKKIKPFRPQEKISALSRGYADYDPFGHM